jgi:hypothetical protein
MYKRFFVAAMAILLLVAAPVYAELQNVLVGGEVRIRGNWWTSAFGPDSLTSMNPLFQGPWAPSFSGVPGGNPLAGLRWAPQPGRLAVGSPVGWDEKNHGYRFVEQRTKLNVCADFTELVSAFIEFDSYDVWGETPVVMGAAGNDFRSNYVTGVDGRANTADDIEVYQSYIQANEMFGTPLRLRIGRQELKFGSGWLMGTNEAGSFFRGLSFDGIRATYATDLFSVDAFWAKLAERSPLEEDADTDLYGVYASYLGFENITVDAYWLMVRDSLSRWDTQTGWIGEWIEDALGVDNYDPTYLHTVGVRGAGKVGAFDFEAEVAYQFGDADSVGATFANAGLISPYGDDDAEFGAWGGNLQVGYTLDTAWAPRLFLGGAYFGGEDNRDLSFVEWLGAVACPFWSAEASVSFNRLFSDWQYGQFVSSFDHDCSNLWAAYGGVMVHPTEALTLVAAVSYVNSLEQYDITWPSFFLLGRRINLLYPFSFIDQENPDDLCWEASLTAVYRYTEDLSFEAGYSHMFLGDGAAAGNFNIGNGLGFEGGTSDDDADYFYFETKIKF